MSFAPDFVFYGDGREINRTVADWFWDAMKAEAVDELERRASAYPRLVAKGRMSRADADRELRVWRAIAEDWRAAPRSAATETTSWTEMVHCLRRELALRRQFYPTWILQGRMTAEEADRKIEVLEIWHDGLWHLPGKEAEAARAAIARIHAQRELDQAA